jgi:glycosyltransferase involved in cell wall biosynthesis
VSTRVDADVVLTANFPGDDPEASVIVATHNHGHYLGEALDGIARQKTVALELILVDDASTDDTEAVVREFAARTDIAFTYLRLSSHGGKAVARNCGLDRARGNFCAFTDADCVPHPRWALRAIEKFEGRPRLGMVQGRTECHDQHPEMFSHFIETLRFDGSYSTSNIVYRRSAIGAHRFDSSCDYWEDTEFGFQVRSDDWEVDFAPEALVYHQVVPQSVATWLLWPRHYVNWPAKVARYPEFRRTLFLKTWVRPLHACLDLALGGVVAWFLGRRRLALVLCAPYAVAFTYARGLGGRAPLAKVVLHAVRDLVASSSLLAGSIRYRRVVL